MGFLIFLCGTVFGAILGVTIMCCLQINRINKSGETKKDPPFSGGTLKNQIKIRSETTY